MIDPRVLRGRIARVEATTRRIAAMPASRRIESIRAAAALLLDGEQSLGRGLRTELERTSGLSSEGIAWALDTTIGAMQPAALRATLDAAERSAAPGRIAPRGLVAVVLSANVTTAPLFALAMPLLFGNAVVAKASRRDDVVARAFQQALAAVDEELAESLDVLVFEGGDVEREDALLARASAVVAYGGDATIAALRARTPPTAAFVAHGHGLGAALLSREWAREPARRAEALAALALDVAAYDQHGCLSPHLVLVEGDLEDGRRVASELAELALVEVARRMPRGPLPAELGGAQLSWRSLALVHGELFEGDGHATSAEGEGEPRPSPGHRNLQVLTLADRSRAGERLRSLGVHLKILGIGGDEAFREAVVASLAPPLAPRVVPLGAMQTPSFGATWDAELPFTGLVRYAAGP